jgi:ankyrin repeat protein
MEEIREGKREGSIISTKNGHELDVDDQEAWIQLRRELEDVGLSPTVLRENMEFIKNWFKEAFTQNLLEEVRPSTDEKNEAFLRAAKAGHTALVESLLASTVDLDYVDPKSGQNALHITASASHEHTVQALVVGGVCLEPKDSSGKTVLGLAVHGGNVAIVEIFLRYGINVDESSPSHNTAFAVCSAERQNSDS